MDVISAHRLSIRHRTQLEASDRCGCFYCLAVFSPSEVVKWIDGDNTALCPTCGIDSVIGSASGLPITPEFLSKMHAHWF